MNEARKKIEKLTKEYAEFKSNYERESLNAIGDRQFFEIFKLYREMTILRDGLRNRTYNIEDNDEYCNLIEETFQLRSEMDKQIKPILAMYYVRSTNARAIKAEKEAEETKKQAIINTNKTLQGTIDNIMADPNMAAVSASVIENIKQNIEKNLETIKEIDAKITSLESLMKLHLEDGEIEGLTISDEEIGKLWSDGALYEEMPGVFNYLRGEKIEKLSEEKKQERDKKPAEHVIAGLPHEIGGESVKPTEPVVAGQTPEIGGEPVQPTEPVVAGQNPEIGGEPVQPTEPVVAGLSPEMTKDPDGLSGQGNQGYTGTAGSDNNGTTGDSGENGKAGETGDSDNNPSDKGENEEQTEDDEIIHDPDIDVKELENSPENLTAENGKKPKKPNVKGNKPKLTWKTAVAVAAGIGIGSAVFFAAGPMGVGIMMAAGTISKIVINKKRNKLQKLGGQAAVENIEEPKPGIKGAFQKFKKYINSEEGLRDISWMISAALITGGTLNVASQLGLLNGKLPTPTNVTSEVTNTNPTVQPTATQSATVQPTTVQPTTVQPTAVQATPQPVSSPYDNIVLGDGVGNYNVSVGHMDSISAVAGENTKTLISQYVNSGNSIFNRFAAINPDGSIGQIINTNGLSITDFCAQNGLDVSQIAVDVASKDGISQAWINASELVSGMGGPTL